jgi:hypothetical protein
VSPSIVATLDEIIEDVETAPEEVIEEPKPRGDAMIAVAEPPTDPTPPVLEADDDIDDIEIVDELQFDEVIDESVDVMADVKAEPDDPFLALVDVLEAVARGAGAGDAALASLRLVLGRERVTEGTSDELLVLREQAAAWQAVLRGESEDFAACGVPSLDEWSSLVVARTLGEMNRAEALRRELRRRGVAAFGLVIEAA